MQDGTQSSTQAADARDPRFVVPRQDSAMPCAASIAQDSEAVRADGPAALGAADDVANEDAAVPFYDGLKELGRRGG